LNLAGGRDGGEARLQVLGTRFTSRPRTRRRGAVSVAGDVGECTV